MTNMTKLEKQLLFTYTRKWINQPSKLQRWHQLHGLIVWAKESEKPEWQGWSDIVYENGKPNICSPTLVENLILSNKEKK